MNKTDGEIEIYLNGKILGRKPAGKANKYIASFELNYEAGELGAAAYKDGKKVSSTVLKTEGEPAAIQLTPD